MTKEQIGKEIKELIRSIKTHYTFVEEEDRIPMIELELITSKIRKLYEKSIINNYLHSTDESFMLKERSHGFKEKIKFEKKISDSYEKSQGIESKPINDFIEQSIETQINAESKEKSTFEEEKNQEVAPATSNNTVSNKSLKDLKYLIGINDKFLLINNLFARNDSDYKTAINYLNSLQTFVDAKNYMLGLARQNTWNVESYAFVRFLQIIEKRHK